MHAAVEALNVLVVKMRDVSREADSDSVDGVLRLSRELGAELAFFVERWEKLPREVGDIAARAQGDIGLVVRVVQREGITDTVKSATHRIEVDLNKIKGRCSSLAESLGG